LRWPTRRTGTIEQNTAAGTHYAWAETGPSATPRDGPRYPMPPSRDRLRWCAWCSMWRRSGQPRPPPGELCQERHRRCSPVRQNRRDAEKHARSPHPPRLRAGSSSPAMCGRGCQLLDCTPGEADEGAAGCRPRPGWRVGPSPGAKTGASAAGRRRAGRARLGLPRSTSTLTDCKGFRRSAGVNRQALGSPRERTPRRRTWGSRAARNSDPPANGTLPPLAAALRQAKFAVPQICHGWLSRHRQILDKLIFINGAGDF